MDIDKLITKLRAAEQTQHVVLSLKRLVDLRAGLIYALEEIECKEKEAEAAARAENPPTEEEQDLINQPLANKIEVVKEEIVKAVESVKKPRKKRAAKKKK